MGKAKTKLLTVKEFAKEIGRSWGAVHYAIKVGRLKAVSKGNTRYVDLISGKKEWAENTNKKMSEKSKSKTQTIIRMEKVEPEKYEGQTTAQADRKDKVFKAKLSELKFQEQSGELVSVKQVRLEAFEIGRKVRNAIMNVPGKTAHELVAITDPHKMENRMKQILTETFDKIITLEKP